MIGTGRNRREGRGGATILALLALVGVLGSAAEAGAQACSDFGGVLDGFAGDIAPSQLQIDQNCTIRNYPASNPIGTNFSFFTQPGQNEDRWLVIFDNVVHTGNMSCNATHEHKIWFVNGSSSKIKQNCQNLLIPVEKIDKAIPPGPPFAAIGVPFTYTLTMPVLFDPATDSVIDDQGSANDLHGITMVDDLNETGVDLSYVSHTATLKSTGLPIAHTFTNVGGVLTFDNFPIVPAGEQIILELTVVLEDTPANAPGTSFINIARWDFGRLIDGEFFEPLPGENGISEPLTIAAPDLVMTKSGPATLGLTLNLGQFGTFRLDLQNTGQVEAWDVTILDRLPDGPSGGMCDTTPEVLSARVFESDGSTPASPPLVPGTDFSVSYAGAPTCEWTLVMLTPNTVIGPGQRLVVDYRTKLDADTQDGVPLTNVAGATEWWNGDDTNPDRVGFSRSLTNGTPGTADHEDEHTVTSALFGLFYEKSVENLDSGANPATTAAPGDDLRYTLRLQATDVPLSDLTFRDDLGSLNPGGARFVPGSLNVVSLPAGAADVSNANGGSNGDGLLEVTGIDVPASSEVVVQFEVTLDAGLADGTLVTNQSDLISGGIDIADSDDPNVNGQADPDVDGDEDPTQLIIEVTPPPDLLKENTQATAAIGESFAYRVTVPPTPHTGDLFDVRILDDLSASAADLEFVSVSRISGPGVWTPQNTGTATDLVIEDPATGIDIPAGEQVVVEIVVQLLDTGTNVAGLAFSNTASYTYELVDGGVNRRPGGPGTTPPMTVVEPELTMDKSGPALMTVGAPGGFSLDVHNAGGGTAWNTVLRDVLPAEMCGTAPSNVSAGIFESDGSTAVANPLTQGVDYSVSWSGAPSCELSLAMLSTTAAIEPDQRLIVSYDAQVDAGTPDGATLENVAGATEWFSAQSGAPVRRDHLRTLTNGTPGVLDHEDVHSVLVGELEFVFEKTVANLDSGADPATTAAPGDRLLYRLRMENLGPNPISELSFTDELDRLNVPPAFQAGTLSIVSAPAGADTSGTDPNGGASGTGLVDVRGFDLPGGAGNSVLVEFEVTLAPVLANGTVVTNQSQAAIDDVFLSDSDDPNVGGSDDPTQIVIASAPDFLVQKVSDDISGDPALLLAGETLRYTISVQNVGNADASDAVLRDAIPANTSYVAGSTTLNGNPVGDVGGTSPLVAGVLLNAPPPEDQTPGFLRADAAGAPANVATVVFEVVVDPGTPDGTVISNQGFVSAPAGGVFDTPSDDPDTPLPDDPTRDVVGATPLLFAPKSATLAVDNLSPGIVDPGDTLLYTIEVQNTGPVPATAAMLTDAVPANTSYVGGSTTLNGNAVSDPPGGFPLASGLPIASPDQPAPGPGGGTISPGESAVVQFRLLVDAGTPAGTVIENQAVVATAERPDLLTDGDGNPATGPEPTRVVVGAAQQLAIDKQVFVVGGGPALAGSELEYVVTVTNFSPVPAQDVVITDDLDDPVAGHLVLVGGSARLNGLAAGVSEAPPLITADYSTTYGPLAPGATAVLRFRATIAGGLANGTTVTNVAEVRWNDPPETATASVSIDVGGVPGVAALSGSVWHDADFDLVQAPGEIALANWTVELLVNGVPAQSTSTAADGSWSLGGIAPNDVSGQAYALRFSAPDAVAGSAALGRADSPFTDGLQRIDDIVVGSGANLANLNLPLAPNGVVYSAVARNPVPGAIVTLLDAGGTLALPTTCFDDPNQQSQTTLSRGYYRFDLNFSDGACPSGASYVIAVQEEPGGGTAVSQLIGPASDASTAPYSVPACPADAVGGTAECEAVAQETAPASGDPSTYYLHLTLDGTQAPETSQIFNNHIPIDPELSDVLAITKTTPLRNVSRGQLVPYTITVFNSEQGDVDVSVVDTMPPGFRYVEDSAHVDGEQVEPLEDGRELSWPDVVVPAGGQIEIVLLLAVGAGVGDGEFTNSATALFSGLATGRAQATVRVVPDPTFDCTDVLGKVFDDKNRNGSQDRGERGLQGVRVATARGLVATSDEHGRFHITCAVVPREDRGSNFVLKLDDRTLPSGYRMTTRQTQVKRATRGKALRYQFGASVLRVVGLDLADPVFEPDTAEMRPQWRPRLALLVEELAREPSILRLSYVGDTEDAALVERRVEAVRAEIEGAWEALDREPLRIETEVYWRRGAPPEARRGLGARLGSVLPSVDAGPPPADRAGAATERHLPDQPRPRQWSHDPERLDTLLGDSLEEREVVSDAVKIVKLKGVVPPIRFASGVAQIPPATVQTLRSVLDDMRHLDNVRLHLVGHADDQPLSSELAGVFGDNQGLSRERAGEAAEFLQAALMLPPESISFAWAGDSEPVASNATEAGRALNRRVEVEVWYDEQEQQTSLEEVLVEQDFKRVKVCRTETVCKLRYLEGQAYRSRIQNLIPPLTISEESVRVPADFVRQVAEALHNLRSESNVTVKFIGYTDDAPLEGRAARIYGTHLALSKAQAHRVALAVKDALDLPTAAVASDGRGSERPIASNETASGRALNQRVEVEFWHDDPLAELPDAPQLCPDAGAADVVTRVYEPPSGPLPSMPIQDGDPQLPPDLLDRARRALEAIADRTRPRLRFVGYTKGERLDRRTAAVYGDDVGLSTARARRAMEAVLAELELAPEQAEHEGRGFVHASDVVNAGFLQGESSYVRVEAVYDELAVLDDLDGVQVTPLTRELLPQNPLALNLMRITVDGEPLDDPARSSADIQRCTDVALDAADIRFRFDGLEAAPRLAVTAERRTVSEDVPVRFRAYSNYAHFLERSEVRIFEQGASTRSEPLAVVELDAGGVGEWRPEAPAVQPPQRELAFLLRAYDAEGRFDETEAQSLWLVPPGTAAPADPEAPGDPLLAGYGESGTLSRGIPLGRVGAVRVDGEGIPPEHTVMLAGTPVPVDGEGRFVAEVLIPDGLHTVEVAVLDAEGNGELFLRDLEIEQSDWFYVGIADLTLSTNFGDGPDDELLGRDNTLDPDSNADGRLAFFVDGRFAGDWRLRASADTREEPLEDLFTNFLDKSPESLFRRIDPDYHYPTFGDDGTVEETAPTSGKFYVKLSRRESHALWGNFEAEYLDNELAHVDRGLYGGNLRYESDAATSFGEKKLVVDGFAADPGTVGARDEFRGTGGSLYYLRRQDLLVGSERLRVEVRDKVSGIVTGVVHLRPTTDYDIDYLQGRVMLTEPVSATVADQLLVRSDGLSGNEAWLVAQYEYTPGVDELDTLALGGRAHAWLGDHLKLGVTANDNDDDSTDSSLYAADLTARLSSASWLKVQAGRSEGALSTEFRSLDGGFDFASAGAPAAEDEDALAYRGDVSVGLSDFIDGAGGRLHLYAQQLEEGYSAPGQLAFTDTQVFGGLLTLPLGPALELTAKADHRVEDDGLTTTAEEVNVTYHLTEYWDLSAGVRHEDRDDDSPVVPVTQDEGQRTDAVVQVGFDTHARWRSYVFGQATVDKDGDREDNHRGGVGGGYRVTDRLSLDGEASYGSLGPAVKLGTRFQMSEDTQRYLSYALENERGYDGVHARRGNLVSGIRTRLSDSSSVYLEDRFEHGDQSRGLARAMGITLSPDEHWSFGANWELGTITDARTHAETDRRSGGARVSYHDERLSGSSAIEYRFDDIEQPDGSESDRTTWLFRNSLRYQLTPGGRVIAKLNHSFSDSSEGSFFDGGFTEGVLGYAFRPVAHDRLHVLAKYTYFYNMPTTDQVGANNTPTLFLQKSHIAAIDATYDVTDWFSLGGKYAYRLGQVSIDRDDPDFFDNNAHLYIIRGDLRFLESWEALLEGRMLDLPDLDERKSGALFTIYRYLGENFKVGVGYNFTDFSEDLTDLDYDDHGLFFNFVGTL